MSHDAFSLLEMNTFIQEAIQGNFPDRYKVVAEIASAYENRTGHCYLELIQKGENETVVAKCTAMIWSYTYRMLKPYFETSTGRSLSAGLSVLLDVSVSFHPVYGYSLQVRDIDPAYTLGEAALQKQKTLKRLYDEGLIELNKQLDEPVLFQRIAVVSSASAAGYEDFCEQLRNNPYHYVFSLTLFPAIMQGDQAVASVTNALLSVADRKDAYDAVVLIRGGGARSDLHCFDSYDMAAEVARCPLPVITGIGHERDESVVDQLAYAAMKTPTAVAEFLILSMYRREQHLRELFSSLSAVLTNYTTRKKHAVHQYSSALNRLVDQYLAVHQMETKQYSTHLRHHTLALLEKQKTSLAYFAKSLSYLDPVNILKKGYSLTLLNGRTVKDAKQLHPGDVIETRLLNGRVQSEVVLSKK